MKKKLKLGIGLLLISIIGYLGYGITKKISYKTEVAERIKIIPSFSFVTLNNTPFSEKNLDPNKTTIFVYFNSECDFCKHETQQISEHLTKFGDSQIVFISFEKIETIKTFAKKYTLLDKENVLFLHDKNLEFADIFDAKSIPFVLIYNKNNQLVQKFKGQTKVEKILELLN